MRRIYDPASQLYREMNAEEARREADRLTTALAAANERAARLESALQVAREALAGQGAEQDDRYGCVLCRARVTPDGD